jgi:predicted dehydrogenase
VGDLFQDRLDETIEGWKEKPKEKYAVTPDRTFVGWDAYQKVLASDIDYVILATAPGFRPMMMKAAIEAGKHVFAEKPVAVDPAGVRMVLEAAKMATEKNLGIVAGTQRRHQPSYVETIKRIKDGAIGDIVSGSGYWMQGGLWSKPREAGWSDMEWQIRNWLYFTWLSGDHIVEQHLHQIDIMNWVMGGPPKLCIGMGGRMARTDPVFGHIYDFFSVQYEYANGVKWQSMCRQIDGTYGRTAEEVIGTKGKAIPERGITEGPNKWRYESEKSVNPYEQEHTDLIESIRAGKPINEGKATAESTLSAVMGRMSAYTGKLVTFRQAMESPLDLFPKNLGFGPLPVPPVAIPGKEEAPSA